MDWPRPETVLNSSSHQSYLAIVSSPVGETPPESTAAHEPLFVSLSSTGYALLALVTCAGLLVSLISNMIIIYLFIMRNPSNIIAVNLSLSDLLYCSQWPSVIYCSLTQSTKILQLEFVCQTFGFITVSTALASILTVLAMTIERALVISYSVGARSRFTIRAAWLVIMLIWALAIASCLPPLFGKFNRYTLDPSKTSCTLDYLSERTNHKLYIAFLFVAYWLLPTLMLFISYGSILLTFKRSSLSLCEIESSSNPRPMGRRFGPPADSFRLKVLRDGLRANTGSDKPPAEQKPTPSRLLESHALGARTLLAYCAQGADGHQDPRAPALTDLSVRRLTTETVSPVEELHEKSVATIESRSRTSGSVSSRYRGQSGSFRGSANCQTSRAIVQFRLAKTSFYLILLWLVSWTPIASLAALNSVLTCHKTSATAVFIANTMTKLGPAFDVFIYGISHPRIKSKFKQIFKRLFMLGNAPGLSRGSDACNMLLASGANQTSLRSLPRRAVTFERLGSWDSMA